MGTTQITSNLGLVKRYRIAHLLDSGIGLDLGPGVAACRAGVAVDNQFKLGALVWNWD